MNENSHFFLAIPIPDQIKAYLWDLSEQLQKQLDYKIWTNQADYHITLTFLGSVKEQQLSFLSSDLLGLNQSIAPFKLSLNQMGYFGKKEQPRVLWAGVQHHPLLLQCQQRVSDICSHHGFRVDKRKYNPHITIGKKWLGINEIAIDSILNKYGSLYPYNWRVDSITLYKIMLNEYPKYKAIKHFLFMC